MNFKRQTTWQRGETDCSMSVALEVGRDALPVERVVALRDDDVLPDLVTQSTDRDWMHKRERQRQISRQRLGKVTHGLAGQA